MGGGGSIPDKAILTNSWGDTYRTIGKATKGEATKDPDTNDEHTIFEYTILVESEEIGKKFNLSAGSELIFQSPINGIQPTVTVAAGGIVGGSDHEEMEDYRNRILERIRSIQTGGNRQDYIKWTKEIDGVGDVFVIEHYLGRGQVGVTFTTNDRDNLIPETELVGKVREHIKEKKPFGSVVFVFAPTQRAIDMEIRISPYSDDENDEKFKDLQNNVKNNLKEMFKLTAHIGGVVYYSKISEAISLAEGEESHELSFKTSAEGEGEELFFTNIQLENNEIAVLGDVDFKEF